MRRRSNVKAQGVRERNRLRVREKLARVALRLYRARGFDATTVDDIARAAKVSRRTVFRYFPNKESLVFPHHEERVAAFREWLRPERGETPLRALRRATLRVGEVYSAAREEVVEQYHVVQSSPALVAHELELDREWQAAMAEALRKPGRTPDGRAELLAGMTMGVIR